MPAPSISPTGSTTWAVSLKLNFCNMLFERCAQSTVFNLRTLLVMFCTVDELLVTWNRFQLLFYCNATTGVLLSVIQ